MNYEDIEVGDEVIVSYKAVVRAKVKYLGKSTLAFDTDVRSAIDDYTYELVKRGKSLPTTRDSIVSVKGTRYVLHTYEQNITTTPTIVSNATWAYTTVPQSKGVWYGVGTSAKLTDTQLSKLPWVSVWEAPSESVD